MLDAIQKIRSAAENEISAANNIQDLEQIRITYLARKGQIGELFDKMKDVSADERPAMGKALNELRTVVQNLFDVKKSAIESGTAVKAELIDLTLPGRRPWLEAHIRQHGIHDCRWS
jgi:phenylalanyl-tRNA synthetase alpha chain